MLNSVLKAYYDMDESTKVDCEKKCITSFFQSVNIPAVDVIEKYVDVTVAAFWYTFFFVNKFF